MKTFIAALMLMTSAVSFAQSTTPGVASFVEFENSAGLYVSEHAAKKLYTAMKSVRVVVTRIDGVTIKTKSSRPSGLQCAEFSGKGYPRPQTVCAVMLKDVANGLLDQ